MSYGPFYNPPVPFCTSFHSGISDGTVVIINGSILPTADRLAVNFACGPCGTDDIAFHFNPRFDQKTVVCNTMQNNNWGIEEVKSELPFHWALPFELRILVTSLNYKVSVNKLHFLEYRHRISLQRVNTLTIGGPLCLTSVEIQPKGPPPCNPCPCPTQYAIPFQTNINGGLFQGKVIVIRGAVAAHNPQRFNIDLNFCGGIAFHFNPRFNEKTIVRNSMLNNSWGKEELELHCGGFCFAPGQSFVIEIICEHHHFRVNVNGNHVCNFNYRVPNLQQINSLGIGGDVVLQHVQI
ncbi:galectin-9-like [Ranitomeya variabilis]|uniref:galectin-9-like n=1 Tax=Ranitomeya variabilis TaxID=490064 RepID=UPI00405655B8